MNNRQYQAIPAISSHRLIAMLQSPAHCWRQYLDPDRKPEESSDALKLGTLVHCLALNPQDFDNEFLVADYERRSKAGKARYAELQQYGLTVIKSKELEKAQAIVSALKRNKTAARLTSEGEKEKMFMQPRSADLLPLKSRLDVHNESEKLVVELKTTRDISTLEKAITDYHYPLSAAFYLAISHSLSFVFVFVQTSEPYEVAIFEPTREQLDQGRDEMQAALHQFDACWLANHWPEATPEPALDDDPLMMNFLPTKPNRQRFETEVGELAL